MPSPERPRGEPSNEQKGPYQAAVQFERERPALLTYARLQRLIFQSDCDLSVYRFTLRGVSHVAILGAPPSPELQTKLQTLLAAGGPAALPPEVVQTLWERRAQATKLGPWVEGHYRPGREV